MGRKAVKSDFEKLPKRVRRVITIAREGRKLCKFLRKKETGETEVNYFFEPGGKQVGEWTARRAISSGFMIPGNDGLFEATDQSWSAKP